MRFLLTLVTKSQNLRWSKDSHASILTIDYIYHLDMGCCFVKVWKAFNIKIVILNPLKVNKWTWHWSRKLGLHSFVGFLKLETAFHQGNSLEFNPVSFALSCSELLDHKWIYKEHFKGHKCNALKLSPALLYKYEAKCLYHIIHRDFFLTNYSYCCLFCI